MLGAEDRPGICTTVETQTAELERYLALGRGGHHDQRREAPSLARRRSGRLCPCRDRPKPSGYRGGQALTGATFGQAGLPTQAHHHRQTGLLYRRSEGHHAECRTSLPQGTEQSSAELPYPASKARTANARISILAALQRFAQTFSTVRNLFVPPRPRCSVLAIHLHRLKGIAEWKSAAAVAT